MSLPDRWWRLYDDPVLDGLVEQAFAANTDLRVANANLARSMALLGEAHARRQVQAGFSSEVSEQQRSAEQVLSHVQPHERPLYDIGVAVGYDLDLFGGIRRGIEAASADSDAPAARAILCGWPWPPKPLAHGPTSAMPETRWPPWSRLSPPSGAILR
jgi:outer membrane protein TolC